jgi:hypothetical protein
VLTRGQSKAKIVPFARQGITLSTNAGLVHYDVVENAYNVIVDEMHLPQQAYELSTIVMHD